MKLILLLALVASTILSAETGVCSYYARSHNGHITAGGQKFDNNTLTAAHRKYPMGTKLKVTVSDPPFTRPPPVEGAFATICAYDKWSS